MSELDATSSPATPSRLSTPAVRLVTQTRILPERADEFARWQQHVNEVIAKFPGYLDHTVIPPAPPVQTDWVIVQRFETVEAARAWLQAEQRQHLLEAIEPLLVGQDDIHLFTEDAPRGSSAPVSAVISTRLKPGQQDAFLCWHQRVAVAQAKFEGFEGYKLEPPISGVQDDWVTILRFDSPSHLQAWLNSEQRKQLLQEAAAFSVETHTRNVRNGFETWFPSTDGHQQSPPAGWKMNMLVLLTLYPTVFLFSLWVQTPLLIGKGMPLWLAFFLGNAFSTALLGWVLVPLTGKLFDWWLSPSERSPNRVTWAGAGLVLFLYAVCLLVFSRFP
jgi:uncharacterized protein